MISTSILIVGVPLLILIYDFLGRAKPSSVYVGAFLDCSCAGYELLSTRRIERTRLFGFSSWMVVVRRVFLVDGTFCTWNLRWPWQSARKLKDVQRERAPVLERSLMIGRLPSKAMKQSVPERDGHWQG